MSEVFNKKLIEQVLLSDKPSDEAVREFQRMLDVIFTEKKSQLGDDYIDADADDLGDALCKEMPHFDIVQTIIKESKENHAVISCRVVKAASVDFPDQDGTSSSKMDKTVYDRASTAGFLAYRIYSGSVKPEQAEILFKRASALTRMAGFKNLPISRLIKFAQQIDIKVDNDHFEDVMSMAYEFYGEHLLRYGTLADEGKAFIQTLLDKNKYENSVLILEKLIKIHNITRDVYMYSRPNSVAERKSDHILNIFKDKSTSLFNKIDMLEQHYKNNESYYMQKSYGILATLRDLFRGLFGLHKRLPDVAALKDEILAFNCDEGAAASAKQLSPR